MNRTALIFVSVITAVIMLSSCSRPQQNGFGGNGGQEKAITVLVQEVQPGNLEKYIRISGKLEGVSDVTLISETSGKIVSVNKKLGDWIHASESIGRVDN